MYLDLLLATESGEVCSERFNFYAPGPIGSNSTLIFTISLKDIKKNEAPQGGMPFQLTPEMLQQLQQQGLQGDAPAEGEEAPAPAPAPEAPAPAAEA